MVLTLNLEYNYTPYVERHLLTKSILYNAMTSSKTFDAPKTEKIILSIFFFADFHFSVKMVILTCELKRTMRTVPSSAVIYTGLP